jgi:hypothetical protein
VSIGQGALRVTVGYPSGPFTNGYRDSTPRLSVDGVEHAAGWGVHTLALPAGPHTVKVVVHGADGDTFGLAEGPATIGLGRQTDLVYRAPRFHGSRGKIKASKEQPKD